MNSTMMYTKIPRRSQDALCRVPWPHCRFSNYSVQLPPKAFPTYTVYAPTGALVFKPQQPQFNIARPSGGLVLAQKGRMSIELVPRKLSAPPYKSINTNNNFAQHVWKDAIRYSLSPEEVGLILNALPHQEVEFSSTLSLNDDLDSEHKFHSSSGTDTIDRVLKLSPVGGSSIKVSIDFVRDGLGGALLPPHLIKYGTPAHVHPIEVEMQTGEWIVVQTLLQHSIPFLLGWTDMLALNNANAVQEAQNPNASRRNEYNSSRAKNYPSSQEDDYGRDRIRDYQKRKTSKISTSDDDIF